MDHFPEDYMKQPLRQGIDNLDYSLLSGLKIALITNHTAVNREGISTLQILLQNRIAVSLVYSLEHGYFPVAQDMESVGQENRILDVPVISLYGNEVSSLEPDPEYFNRFDAIIYDVQDIGSRYYTYLQSLSIFMDYLEQHPKPLFILDRINPINGIDIEGAILEERYASFVGRFPLIHRHGLTSGELARYYYQMKGMSFPMEIIPITGWCRDSFYDDYDYPWIPTSPNMPTVDTAILYPGGCLLEGTNLSEGRGTTFPFLAIGKAGIDPFRLKDELDRLEIPGLTFMPLEFRPMFQKEAGQRCGGVYIHLADRRPVRPFRAYMQIIQVFRRMVGDHDFFRSQPYEFIREIPAIELLLGHHRLIEMVYRQADFSQIDDFLYGEEQVFHQLRKDSLIYPSLDNPKSGDEKG